MASHSQQRVRSPAREALHHYNRTPNTLRTKDITWYQVEETEEETGHTPHNK